MLSGGRWFFYMMSLTGTASLLYDAALALVYPQRCAVCGASVESRFDGIACARCWSATRVFAGDETLCWKCGTLSPGNISDNRRDQVRCRRCDDDAFTAARACGIYEGALRVSVLALKREPHIAGRLLRLLAERCQPVPLNRATRIVPVPLHPERERTRGFNQAALIARELSRLTGLPVDEESLVRTGHTERHRAGMDAHGRRESVANAFTVRHPRLIEGERVLLLDDVFTTGATVSACAGALLAAGAREVFVLTIARPAEFV
jgi:ComF family protein